MAGDTRVAILVRQLDIGGSERQALLLAEELAKSGRSVTVVSFYPGGALEEKVRAQSAFRYRCLEKSGRWDMVGLVARFLGVLRNEQIGVVISFLLGPNILAALVKLGLPKIKLLWCLRNSDVPSAELGVFGWILWCIETALSRIPDQIVFNSEAGLRFHLGRYMCKRAVSVIRNGVDGGQYYISASAGQEYRARLGILRNSFVFACVARMDPVKNHQMVVEAFLESGVARGGAVLLIVGAKREPVWSALQDVISGSAESPAIIVIENEIDLLGLYNAIDRLILVSANEGCPNVIVEAMACGKECIVSDVGDCKQLIGTHGVVMAQPTVNRLASELRAAVASGRGEDPQQGTRVRASILALCSIDKMRQSYINLLNDGPSVV